MGRYSLHPVVNCFRVVYFPLTKGGSLDGRGKDGSLKRWRQEVDGSRTGGLTRSNKGSQATARVPAIQVRGACKQAKNGAHHTAKPL